MERRGGVASLDRTGTDPFNFDSGVKSPQPWIQSPLRALTGQPVRLKVERLDPKTLD